MSFDMAYSAEVLPLQADVTGKFTLHWVVAKQSDDVGDNENALVMYRIPGPDARFPGGPRDEGSQYNSREFKVIYITPIVPRCRLTSRVVGQYLRCKGSAHCIPDELECKADPLV